MTRPQGPVSGTSFAVWAPNARGVRVVGDFDYWSGRDYPMRSLGSSGVWELFVPGVGKWAKYKFNILGADSVWRQKADPLAFATEAPPATASVVFTSGYEWGDDEWLAARAGTQWHASPMSIYEVHIGSWRQGLSYSQLAEELVAHVKATGFTHVEFLPVAEHPFGGSWGYQVSSYYAPSARFGNPDDFRYLVDRLHQAGIGVIVDWVPAHFPKDEWALARFDGTPLYEHADPRRGEQPDWGTLVFDFGRREVRNFLVANAAVLARGVPHRRASGRRRRLDALPRLLPQGRRVAAQRLRRPGEPRRGGLPARDERHGLQARAGRRHRCRGVDGVARRHPADASRRAGLRLQVEHGLDARHARLHRPGARFTASTTTTR